MIIYNLWSLFNTVSTNWWYMIMIILITTEECKWFKLSRSICEEYVDLLSIDLSNILKTFFMIKSSWFNFSFFQNSADEF